MTTPLDDRINDVLVASDALFKARRLLKKAGVDPVILQPAIDQLGEILDRLLVKETN